MFFPKQVLRTARSSTSSFDFQHPLISLRWSSSCLHLPPQLPITSNLPFIYPSTKCFRKQFLRKMWPIQLALLLFIVLRTFLISLTPSNTSSFFTRSFKKISILLQHHISRLSRYIWSIFLSVLGWSAYKAMPKCSTRLGSSLNLSAICRWTKSFLLNCKEMIIFTLYILSQ